MRLFQIKLAGFKTFVEPTTITIPGKLVGIVGPNGCGKSNVIDAVRWVLGESRAGTLRGDSIQDVIFSGSINRKPVGRASVELIFDNTLSKITNQWSSYTEISIKRVVQRDGDSAYFINNTHVRRRDIIDLFLGTGVSSRGYAIIEQGMISRIVEAKPQELRSFLEEAAGIAKYRERRHETELRLVDARSNLLRVKDILQELEKQLLHVKEQAATAQRFNTLQAELRQVNSLLWLHSQQEATNLRIKASTEIEQLTLKLEKEASNLHEFDKNLEALRIQHSAISDDHQHAQASLYAIEAKLARTEQELRHREENKQAIQLQIDEANMQLERNQSNKNQALNELTHLYLNKEEIDNLQKESRQQYETENETLPELEHAFRITQNELSLVKQKYAVTQETSKFLFNQLAHCEKTIHQSNQKRERLIQEKNTQVDSYQEKIITLQTALEQVTLDIESKQIALTEIDDQLITLEQSRKETLQTVQHVQQQLTSVKARHDALARLQHQLENNEALTRWITHNQLDQLPRLWQHVEIEAGWEGALESLLQERLNAVLVNRLEATLEWTSTAPGPWHVIEECLNNGSIENSALPIDFTNNTDENGFPKEESLSSLVNFTHLGIEKIVKQWLQGVFTISDIKTGLRFRHELAPTERFITSEGHLISQYSLFYYAPNAQFHGVLQRQREIIQLNSLIDQHHKEFLDINEIYSEIEKNNERCKQTRSTLQHELSQTKQAKHDLSLELVKLSEFTQRIHYRNQQIDEELMDISMQIETETIQKQEVESNLAMYKVEIEQLSFQIDQLNESVESAEKELIAHRQLVQHLSNKWRDSVMQFNDCQNKITQNENNVNNLDQSSEVFLSNIEKLKQSLYLFENKDLQLYLHEQTDERVLCEQSVTKYRQALEEIVQIIRNSELARMHAEQTINQYKERVNELKLKHQEAYLIENQLNEKLIESGSDINALLPQIQKVKPSVLKTELNRINTELASVGLVNLAAIEELQAIQSRFTFLDLQSTDLENAVMTLENAIHQIDGETRERLQATFDRVNLLFHELFTSVFGGGSAKLTLSGEEILDATIQLIAQPPGKKNNSIHLLSGGEKALTALTLIFSLFQLNPAPFCLLDEVDAPLDDINAMRFCELVMRMSNETQFLFISHNKISMQMAEQLIGVTMAEQGVSRIVSVNFDNTINSMQDHEAGLV
ncbi:MAG: chromosome segregation protein SMC [Nitrosomonas sp.]|nr:chromosome segregation protein SMC [Nitrosomonas sp.]